MAMQRASDLAGAERELRAVLAESPGMPMVCALLGRILNETDRAEETVAMLGPIAEREPGRPLVRLSLGMGLNKLGRYEEALGHLEAVCEIRPADMQGFFWRGATLTRLGRYEEGDALFRRTIDAARGDPMELGQLGRRLFVLGRYEVSAEAYERAIEDGATDASMLLRLASSYYSQRRYGDALDRARRAMAKDPKNPSAYMVVAEVHEKTHELEKAAASAREGLRLEPTHTVLARVLARLERRLGRGERAAEITARALEAGVEDPRLRSPLLMERGQALDATGRHDEAFEAFREGKAVWLESTGGRYGFEAFPSRVGDRREAVRRMRGMDSGVRSGAASGVDSGVGDAGEIAPVFFIGFPRSGTTLMEQVLRAHPGIVTLDEVELLDGVVAKRARELTGASADSEIVSAVGDGQIPEIRRAYLEESERQLGEALGGRLLVDKLPLNITRIGLIRRVFPGARLLVALRDPRDCCLSGFMQSFEANEAMVHFHSVASAARLYAAVMDLWLEAREAIGEPYLEYRYEDLTADFEGTVREVLAFLGQEWDEGVLRFQEGARKRAISTPSYERVVSAIDRKAVARWRKYEAHMGEALAILRPYVEAFGYDD